MICKFILYFYFYTKLYIYEFLYKFDTVLYQFLEKGTSDITIMGRDQDYFSAYTPFHYSFTVPLRTFFFDFQAAMDPLELLIVTIK